MKVLTEDTSSFFSSPEEVSETSAPFLELIHSSEGGFCELYRINVLGRFRVLKCLKTEYRGNPVYEGLLRKEFEIGFALDHPNICQYYSFRHSDALGNCIEMEWIDGRTLEELIAQERPSPVESDAIFDQICDALSYIHSKQTLLRDLKPSNILVTHKGNVVKLIDFGLSDSASHSVLKIPAGTAIYTAPEVLKGAEADVRSEIYSLGLVIASLGNRHRSVVRKCCEPRQRLRYSSVAEVKKALHSRWPYVSGVLFILLVAAFALYPVVSRWFTHSAITEETKPETVQVDTTVLAPEDAASADLQSSPASAVKTDRRKQETPKQTSTEEEKPVDNDAIDELFRQATELFE